MEFFIVMGIVSHKYDKNITTLPIIFKNSKLKKAELINFIQQP